jgi:hypothetical protein
MLVNISALSCMICMVGSTMFMSVSGLHSLSYIWTRGSCSGSCMYLVSLDCIWWKFFLLYLDNVYVVVLGKIVLIVLGCDPLCWAYYVGILYLWASTLCSCDFQVASIGIYMM